MRFLFTLIFICVSTSSFGQKLSASLASSSAGEGFLLEGPSSSTAALVDAYEVKIGSQRLESKAATRVASGWGISNLSLAESSYQIQYLSQTGKILTSVKQELFDAEDPSLRSWSFPNGVHILRENIATFNIFGESGNLITSLNNSSNSSDGEDISELASDAFGRTIVLFNPKINVGSGMNSRAQILTSDYRLKNLYYSNEFQIGNVVISRTGKLILVVANDGDDKGEAVLFDKFGNELYRLEVKSAMKSGQILEDEKLLVLYSDGRVQVYEMFSTKRLASSSLRGEPIIFAGYSPKSKLVVALTGNLGSDFTVNNPKINITDVGRRKLDNESLSGTLKVHPNFPLNFVEKGSGNFEIKGASQTINVRYK